MFRFSLINDWVLLVLLLVIIADPNQVARVHHLRDTMTERRDLSLSFYISPFHPSNYPKPMKSPLAQVEIKPTWLKTRLMAVGARHSTGGLFVVESLRANFSRGLLLIMRHRNASSFYDRFRERTHTSPRINDRLCRYVLLRYTSRSSSTDA